MTAETAIGQDVDQDMEQLVEAQYATLIAASARLETALRRLEQAIDAEQAAPAQSADVDATQDESDQDESDQDESARDQSAHDQSVEEQRAEDEIADEDRTDVATAGEAAADDEKPEAP